MKTHTTQGTLRLGAPIASARFAVILLHGRGSSPEDIAGLADPIGREDVAYVVPAATNGTWYPQRFLVPTAENEPWLSGALIGPLDTPRKSVELGGVPVLLASAGFEAHIPKAYIEHSASILTGYGAKVTKHLFPGSAHTVFPEEISWLQARLG